jgi:hypothetical protein
MVSTRQLIGAGFLVSAAVVAGCASRPRAKARPAAPDAVAGVSNPESAVEPISPGAIDDGTDVAPRSLAQHTKSYARNLETMMAKRPGAAVDKDVDRGTDAATWSTLPSFPADPATVPDAQANIGMTVALSGATTHTGEAVEVVREARGAEARPSQPSTRPAAEAPRDLDDAQSAGAPSVAKVPAAAVNPNSLLQKLASQIKADPRDAAGHLNYQLLQFLLDEQVPDLGAIAPLPAEDRELLTTLLDGLANFRNGLRADANSLQSKKVAPLLELADRLRAQGELSIPTAALCRSVQRFGVYDPMDPARFVAGGNDNKAILYCEVANFSSQINDQKLWETKLKQEAVLYSETGLAVWSDRSDTVIDQSRNRLHDFFIADKVRLPATLPVGRYLMKMTITDLHASRVAEATVAVQIVAQ